MSQDPNQTNFPNISIGVLVNDSDEETLTTKNITTQIEECDNFVLMKKLIFELDGYLVQYKDLKKMYVGENEFTLIEIKYKELQRWLILAKKRRNALKSMKSNN